MTTKTVYLIDPITMEFKGAYIAQVSPLDPENNKEDPENPGQLLPPTVFIEPVDSVTTAPPTVGANQVPVWDDVHVVWTLQPDYRGQTVYNQTDGTQMEIKAIGPIPNNYALTMPATILMQQAKTAQKQAIQAAYISAINTPVSFTNAAGVASSYPSGNTLMINGQTAKQNLIDAITAGATAWKLGLWLDVNHVAQTFTFADLQGLASAMEAAVTVDWQELVMRFAQIDAAQTIADVQAVVW